MCSSDLGGIKFDVDPPVLAHDEVCYVGEPIALVVATSRAIAEDAIALIDLDIEPLPVVVDPVAGLENDAPKARLDCPDNHVARTGFDFGDADRQFAAAPHVIAERFRMSKGGGHSMEPRGLVAKPDEIEDKLTVWDSTQMPHRARAVLVAALGLTESQVRVAAPSRDELQAVIQFLRAGDYGVELQFGNYR